MHQSKRKNKLRGDLACDKQKDKTNEHLKAVLATAGVSDNFVLSPLGLTFLNEEQISIPLEELRPYFSDEVGL